MSREDVVKYAGDKLPADVTGARAKVDVSFEDVAATCPDEKGAVPGKLRGKGDITVTVERSDGPDRSQAQRRRQYDIHRRGRSGRQGHLDQRRRRPNDVPDRRQRHSTETYRGRISGSGFGKEGILDAPTGGTGAAIDRDIGHLDSNSGGVFGPHGSWRYGRGFPVSDLRTVDNIKAMAATSIATNVLTLASLEYLRKVTLDRIEKSPCGFIVYVDINSRTVTAQYQSFGTLKFSVPTRAVAGSSTRWKGTAPAQYGDLSFTALSECAMHTPVNTPGTFTVDIERLPSGNLRSRGPPTRRPARSIDCPPDDSEPPYDPPPVPGMYGPSLLGVTPTPSSYRRAAASRRSAEASTPAAETGFSTPVRCSFRRRSAESSRPSGRSARGPAPAGPAARCAAAARGRRPPTRSRPRCA